MSYILLENFGGKDRWLKFNMAANDAFWSKIVFNINEKNGVAHASSIYASFYAGLVGNAVVRGEQVDFTYEEVADWVDKLYLEKRVDDIKKVVNCFEETEMYRERLAEILDRVRTIGKDEGEEDDKKKET